MNIINKFLVFVFSFLFLIPNTLALPTNQYLYFKNDSEINTLYGILDVVKPYNFSNTVITNNADFMNSNIHYQSLSLSNNQTHLSKTNDLEQPLIMIIILSALIIIGLPLILIGFVISSAIFQRIVFQFTGYVYQKNQWVILPTHANLYQT